MAAVSASWPAREEGEAGACAAVRDVAEAQQGMDLETPQAIHAEIEKLITWLTRDASTLLIVDFPPYSPHSPLHARRSPSLTRAR